MEPIFVVDNEPAICETVKGVLQDEGYSAISCPDADTLFKKIDSQHPSLVLLDIWLPGTDGMEILRQFKTTFPHIPVIMMSGHAGIDAAVNAIKRGAFDFLEKPLTLEVLLEKVAAALTIQPQKETGKLPSESQTARMTGQAIYADALSLVESKQPQRTLKKNVVLNGHGLLTGRNTGIIVSPLGVNEGIVFQTLDGYAIPAHITSLENFSQIDTTSRTFTVNSTVLARNGHRVRTVEHLMGALSMFGLTNVQIKTDEEIPNIDSSAEGFCQLIQEAGVVDQSAHAKCIVVHEKLGVGIENLKEKHLFVEPFDGFEIQMRVNYPPPIRVQSFTFNGKQHSFEEEIAPARTFNTFENIDMAQKIGKIGSGYLNSHIIMHDGKVINTKLRYPDEFVRHKILDLIGDLYLIGFPIQGRFIANMTSHSYNHSLIKKIHVALMGNSS